VKRSSFGNCLRWKVSIRSRANDSASTVLASQAFAAASISAAVTRRPLASSSSRFEFPRRLDQRGVAARGDVVDNGPRGALDVGRHLALRGEKRGKSLVEIGAAAVEANGHGGFLEGNFGLLLNGAAGVASSTLAT